MSKLDDQYAFISSGKEKFACVSHTDKPASYFFGNTNFSSETADQITVFTCLVCSSTFTFKKLSERSLL